jgi:hypothetical protein
LSERATHDEPAYGDMATYLSIMPDDSAIHLGHAHGAFALCGAPLLEHSHGSTGIVCLGCRDAWRDRELRAILGDTFLKPLVEHNHPPNPSYPKLECEPLNIRHVVWNGRAFEVRPARKGGYPS